MKRLGILISVAALGLHRANSAPKAIPQIASRSAFRAQQSALLWNTRYLMADFQPSANARFVLVPQETKQGVDAARLCFRSKDDSIITVAQTKSIFSVRIETPRTAGFLQPVEEVQALARRIFNRAGKLELKADDGKENEFIAGHVVQMKGQLPWLDFLTWRVEPRYLEFWFLKKSEGAFATHHYVRCLEQPILVLQTR